MYCGLKQKEGLAIIEAMPSLEETLFKTHGRAFCGNGMGSKDKDIILSISMQVALYIGVKGTSWMVPVRILNACLKKSETDKMLSQAF